MITEFHFPSENNKYWCYHCKDFPINLKVGEEIWFDDFEDLLTIGEVYLPEDIEIYEKKCDKTSAVVTKIRYGRQNKEIIKIIYLREI